MCRRRQLASIGRHLGGRAVATEGWRRERGTVGLVGGADERLVARWMGAKETWSMSPRTGI